MRRNLLRHAGLRGRLVLLFLLALSPIVAMEAVSTTRHRTVFRHDAARDATRLARLLAAHLEGTLGSTYQMLRLLDDDARVLAGGAACEAVLQDAIGSTSVYAGVAVTDATGRVVCSIPRVVPPRRPPVFKRSFNKGDFVVTEAIVGPLSGKVVVLAAQAIKRHGEHAGAVIAGLDLTHLSVLAATIDLPRGATFMVVGSEGTVLTTYPHTATSIGRSATRAPIHQAMLESPHTPRAVVRQGVDGTERLFGYAPLEAGGARFFVVVGLDLADLVAPAERRLRGNLASVALAALLALAAAAVAGESFLRKPIGRMLDTANRLARGEVTARTGLENVPGELGELAHGIDQMAAGIQVREERLASLSRQIIEVQESERQALARELHDEIGQALTALKLMLQTLRSGDPVERTRTAEMIAIVERTLQQVRSLSLDLRPPMLDHLGLPATLRWYVAREAERAGFAATFHVHPSDLRLDTRLETTLFRIAQEALTNVARHAAATTAVVDLTASADSVELIVRDDGSGFDVQAVRERAFGGASFGIRGMEERATLAGGRLHIRSGPFGTEVRSVFTRPADDRQS